MTRSNHYPTRLTKTLKYCSSRKKEISQSLDKRVLNLQLEILSHLLMTTFTAHQLGLGVSLKLSKKTQKLLGSLDQLR